MTDPARTTTSESLAANSASPVLGPAPTRSAAGDVVEAPTEPGDAAEVVDVDGPPLPTVAQYKDEDGRVHHASPVSKATRAHVAAGEWTEVDGSAGPFDPTKKLVREVVAHLKEHAGDEAEVARVKAAEATGEDRPTIRDWSTADE